MSCGDSEWMIHIILNCPFFYRWQLKVTEKQGQCQNESNWKPSLINVRCWLALLDEIRTTVKWTFYHTEWAGRALFHFSVFCFVFLFKLIPFLLWHSFCGRRGIEEQEFWVRQVCAQTKQKQICSKGNWNHMDFYVTYVWTVLGSCWGTRGPGDLPEVTLTLGLQAQLPLTWPR